MKYLKLVMEVKLHGMHVIGLEYLDRDKRTLKDSRIKQLSNDPKIGRGSTAH
jgi:hypothetical protein